MSDKLDQIGDVDDDDEAWVKPQKTQAEIKVKTETAALLHSISHIFLLPISD